jgi:hypothetical protein
MLHGKSRRYERYYGLWSNENSSTCSRRKVKVMGRVSKVEEIKEILQG